MNYTMMEERKGVLGWRERGRRKEKLWYYCRKAKGVRCRWRKVVLVEGGKV